MYSLYPMFFDLTKFSIICQQKTHQKTDTTTIQGNDTILDIRSEKQPLEIGRIERANT